MMHIYTAIVVLAAIVFVVMFLYSEARLRGWKEGHDEGIQKNKYYYRLAVDVLEKRIEVREYALALYRDISTTLCDNVTDCMYCPYNCDKQDRRCALWELNGIVSNFDMGKVHVDTKYDGGDED